MKDGWQTETLRMVCQFSNGLWKGKKPPFVNVGVIRNTNFTKGGTLNDSDIVYLDVEEKKLEKRSLKFGDIILEKSGGGPKQAVGRVALFDKAEGHFSFSNFTAALRVIDPKELDFRFLHKFLHWTYLSGVTEGMQSHSTGIRNLNGDAYKAIKITYPPLAEQRRIVGILDEAFEGIATAKANAEKNLQNARAVFESHLNTVFTQRGEGWLEKRLGKLGTITSSKRIFKSEYGKSGVPFYRTKEIKALANSRKITTKLFISKARYKEIKARFGVPTRGDILLTAIGTIGEIYVVEGKEEFYFKDGNVLWLRGFTTINSYFLRYVLVSFVESLNKMAHGSAYSALPIRRLNSHRIFVPSSAEQTAIVSQLDLLREETQRLESTYQQKLAALEELKKSLLHQAFTGEL